MKECIVIIMSILLISCASSRTVNQPYNIVVENVNKMYEKENFFSINHLVNNKIKKDWINKKLNKEGIVVPDLPYLNIKGANFWSPAIFKKEHAKGEVYYIKVRNNFDPLGYYMIMTILNRKNKTTIRVKHYDLGCLYDSRDYTEECKRLDEIEKQLLVNKQ